MSPTSGEVRKNYEWIWAHGPNKSKRTETCGLNNCEKSLKTRASSGGRKPRTPSVVEAPARAAGSEVHWFFLSILFSCHGGTKIAKQGWKVCQPCFFFPPSPGLALGKRKEEAGGSGRKRELRGTRPEGAEVSPAAELRALCSCHFQNTPSRFRRPRPLPGFPRHPLHLHGAAPPPLPLAGAGPRPLLPDRGGVPSPRAARSCGQRADC